MRNKLDELDAAYQRFRAARAAFEQALSARREGLGSDFEEFTRVLDELNLAQQLFSVAVGRIVKGSE